MFRQPDILNKSAYEYLNSYLRYNRYFWNILNIDLKARSHQTPDQPPLSPALEKWTDRQWAGLDRGERILV